MSWTKDRFERIKAWEREGEFQDFIDDEEIVRVLKASENPSRERV